MKKLKNYYIKSERLSLQRKIQKLTLEEVANRSGLSKAYIWDLENNPFKKPSIDSVYKLAYTLNTTADYLMGKDNNTDIDKVILENIKTMNKDQKNILLGIIKNLKKSNERNTL